MANPLNYFDDLEDHVDNTLESLDANLAKANSELLDLITELYYKLDKSSDGTLKNSVDNIKLINSYKAKVNDILENGSYPDAINDYLGEFAPSSDYLNNYFSAISTSFKANNKLYNQILESNINSTAESLLGSGISDNFTDPLLDILKENVKDGSDKKKFMEMLSDSLGEDSKLNSYVNQVATDSIHQFNGNYIDTVSSDLGLKHFFFKGTKKKTSRHQCVKMIGHYFTEKALRQVLNDGLKENNGEGWDGMIPGTNWGNYLVYRNGYNCRHYIIPVSDAVYDSASKKWS